MGTGSFPEVKRLGYGVDHTTSSSAEVKERVELYLYSPLGIRGLFKGEHYLYSHYLCFTMHVYIKLRVSVFVMRHLQACARS
jgi:hypothetical protein